MSKTGNGGPAFPESVAVEDGAVTGSRSTAQGMTLRDYFAGQALAGLTASVSNEEPASWLLKRVEDTLGEVTAENVRQYLAETSYRRATAMIVEKRRREGGGE